MLVLCRVFIYSANPPNLCQEHLFIKTPKTTHNVRIIQCFDANTGFSHPIRRIPANNLIIYWYRDNGKKMFSLFDFCDGLCILCSNMWRGLLVLLFLGGCATSYLPMSVYTTIDSDLLSVATIQRITDDAAPVHFYIEGDGHSFDGAGRPTYDPTPRGTFMRDLAAADDAPNVVYMARPCQFEMDDNCTQSDWTDGRFSSHVIDSMAMAIKYIAAGRPIVLVGYSGGALASGLIIKNYPEIKTEKWITIAGVLNHSDWTQYFGDSPLSASLDLNELPHIPQLHYVAEHDKVVPIALSRRWTGGNNLIIIPGATHNKFPEIKLDFSY